MAVAATVGLDVNRVPPVAVGAAVNTVAGAGVAPDTEETRRGTRRSEGSLPREKSVALEAVPYIHNQF